MNLELKDKVGGRSVGSPLTRLGEDQSVSLGTFLSAVLSPAEIEQARFFSSSAVRTKETARIVMEKMGRSFEEDCVVSERLLELEMGEWEGRLRREVYTEETLDIIRKDVISFKAPGGESQKEVEDRMMQYIEDEILGTCPHEGRSLNIVFGHGLAIKCVLRGVMDSAPHMTRKIVLNNTSITELMYTPSHKAISPDHAGWEILRVNDSGHLISAKQ